MEEGAFWNGESNFGRVKRLVGFTSGHKREGYLKSVT